MTGEKAGSWRERARGAVTKRARSLSMTWVVRIGVAVVLVCSAAFGGLADAAAEPTPSLAADSVHEGTPLTLAVARVVVLDGIEGSTVRAEPGNRLFAIIADVTNTWNKPLPAPTDSFRVRGTDQATGARIASLSGPPIAMQLLADDSIVDALQPGVTARVVFFWQVPAGEIVHDSEVEVGLFDLALAPYGGASIGEHWTNPTLAATMSVTVEDLDMTDPVQ